MFNPIRLKSITLITGIIFLSLALHAQSAGESIAGTIVDKSSKSPVEFVNVQLLKADSTIIKATATDHKGKFAIDDVTAGDYLLRCTYIGYGKMILPVTVTNGQKVKLGTLEMLLQSATMDEVLVTSKKSMMNTSIDRKVYNVGQDIMAQSGAASDILKNVPSVEVDIDGQVSLRGSSDVMILINGRPSPLMGKSRAEVLQQLPANSIERIEVITNPSSRYRPDGTSGIINIVLKKNTKGGWNGSVTANAGNRERYNAGISLNYKPGKVNVFGNYSVRQDRRLRLNKLTREYLDSTTLATKSYYAEDGRSNARPLSHLGTLGVEYNPDKSNSLGISGNYSSRRFTRDDILTKYFYDNNHTLTNNYDRLRIDPEWQKEKDATFFWQHNFPKEDHTLRIEVNTAQSKEEEDNRYTNRYYFPVAFNSFDNTRIRYSDKQQQVTADYSNPLTDDSKLEAGYAGSFIKEDYDFFISNYDFVTGKFEEDKQKTNRFLYNETIHAFYGTYQKSYEKFGYSLGLRLEQAYIKGNQVTKDSVINNDYFRIYPTLHLDYKLKNGELQLNYSRRVSRPEGDDLNPFPEYQDPYNVRAGNPKLLPEIIHSVEMGYKWQNSNFSFVPSVYYRYKQNGFTSVTLPLNDSVLLSSMQNLSNDQSSGLELIFSAKAGNFFSANLSTNVFYNLIDASNLGYSTRKSIIAMSTNFNSTFTITKNTMLQLSCNYRSARLTPQGKNYATFVFNSGIRQDLFKKKMSLTLTASDLFQTLKQKSEISSPYFKQVSTGTRDARIFYIGLSYRFGKVIKKQPEEKLQFDNGL